MNILLKFENGAEIDDEMDCQVPPETVRIKALEGCDFYFREAGTLPSGTILYLETSKEKIYERE